ncbi:MAG TPA: YtxH domain-containing protein [Rubrobacteraceae bacterium]|nr:YtxH domain-containing protein [Rubrobacteraceae bacterium]
MLDKQKIGTFLLGGVAGALAGILLAPKSGKEFRNSVASRAGEARERGRETYFEAQERAQEHMARARERSLRFEETRIEEAIVETLPKFGADTPDSSIGSEAPAETPVDLASVWDTKNVPRLLSGEAQSPEELRRRVQETRARLRAQLYASKPEDALENRDG